MLICASGVVILYWASSVIKYYDTNNPDIPKVFRRGDIADAEPAVPGWRISVNELLDNSHDLNSASL